MRLTPRQVGDFARPGCSAPHKSKRNESLIVALHTGPASTAKLDSYLEVCIAEAAGGAPDGDGEEAAGAKRGQPRRRFDQGMLKELHGQLLTAQAHGYLQLVPQARLQSLLSVLHRTAETAREQLLAEDAEVRTMQLTRVSQPRSERSEPWTWPAETICISYRIQRC